LTEALFLPGIKMMFFMIAVGGALAPWSDNGMTQIGFSSPLALPLSFQPFAD